MRLNTLLNSAISLVISSANWLTRTIQTEAGLSSYAKKQKTTSLRSTVGRTRSMKTNSVSKILDPNWSKFQYVPAAKTDLRESMERYKRMVDAGRSREVHSRTQETRNSKADSGVLVDLSYIRETTVQNSGKRKHRG